MPNNNIICIAVDGLNLSMLGAWGNCTAETPGWNALAAQSVLFDRYHSSSLSLSKLIESFWTGNHPSQEAGNQQVISFELQVTRGNPPAQNVTYQQESTDDQNIAAGAEVSMSLPRCYSANGYHTLLLTDFPLSEIASYKNDFDEIIVVDEPICDHPVRKVEQTHLFACFSKLLERLKASEASYLKEKTITACDEETVKPLFVWAFLKGMRSVWDYPPSLRLEQQEDAEDPLPYPGTAVPFLSEPAWLNDKINRAAQIESDQILALTESWKAGLALLDRGIDSVRKSLAKNEESDSTLLIVVGLRGFPLGEHGRVGFPDLRSSQPQTLFYSEDFHLPLMIRFPQSVGATVRSDALCGPEDVYHFLKAFLLTNQASDSGLFQLASEERESLHQHLLIVENDATSVNRGIITTDWYLRQTDFSSSATPKEPKSLYKEVPIYYELYVRPDDRFDVNEVLDRGAEAVDDLILLL